MLDLSIIIASQRPACLAQILHQLKHQSTAGITYEILIVQEADNFDGFLACSYSPRCHIFRQTPHGDYGAAAHDRGVLEAKGDYVVFWDDDNLYYQHALVAVFATARKHDIGVVRVRHRGLVIPTQQGFKAGDIDSMCFCVRRQLASTAKWADGGGRYSDYRWISKVARVATTINFSPIIIGEHL